jgi:hypothetical protein
MTTVMEWRKTLRKRRTGTKRQQRKAIKVLKIIWASFIFWDTVYRKTLGRLLCGFAKQLNKERSKPKLASARCMAKASESRKILRKRCVGTAELRSREIR